MIHTIIVVFNLQKALITTNIKIECDFMVFKKQISIGKKVYFVIYKIS